MSDPIFENSDLVFVPLGGCGEIGMNLNLFGCDGKWIMVDLGMTFGDQRYPGVDLVFPDPGFIAERKDDLLAIFLTHGHEDHIGAVPYLWPDLEKPMYATPFTAELVRGKLVEEGLLEEAEVRIVSVGKAIEIGPFKITYLAIAHSIAEGNAMLIETPHGAIFHTGDWKLDETPIIAQPTPPEALKAIGDAGILAMTCDSTNVFDAENAGSETSVLDGLLEVVGNCKGRVVVTTFASNVARLDTVGRVAAQTGRYLVAMGRSIDRIINAAKATGYLTDFPDILTADEAAHLPREEILILCTGCQGEPRAALSRMANGDHRDIELRRGDTVIFSSRLIPGNEGSVGALINALTLLDVEVITAKDAPIHVSGHPGRADLEQMYRWIRPKVAVPLHGEARHIAKHARYAMEWGAESAIRSMNGDVIHLAPGAAGKRAPVHSGRILLDGNSLINSGAEAILARRRLAYNGFLTVFVTVNGKGREVTPAAVIATGLDGFEDAGDMPEKVKAATSTAIERLNSGQRKDDRTLSESCRIAARKLCRNELGKNPVVEVRVRRLD